MNYRIVYLLSGNAKKHAERLIKDVSKKFKAPFVYSRKQPPHITLKYRFEIKNVKEVENVLDEVCKSSPPSTFEIGGIGNFDKEVLFLKVKPSKETVKIHTKLVKELKKLDLDWNEFDKSLSKNFHVCIAMQDIGDKFNEIKRYLKKSDKKFKIKFNKIFLIKKPKTKWIIQKEFRIG